VISAPPLHNGRREDPGQSTLFVRRQILTLENTLDGFGIRDVTVQIVGPCFDRLQNFFEALTDLLHLTIAQLASIPIEDHHVIEIGPLDPTRVLFCQVGNRISVDALDPRRSQIDGYTEVPVRPDPSPGAFPALEYIPAPTTKIFSPRAAARRHPQSKE
jgi:hypothetical protein